MKRRHSLERQWVITFKGEVEDVSQEIGKLSTEYRIVLKKTKHLAIHASCIHSSAPVKQCLKEESGKLIALRIIEQVEEPAESECLLP